MSEPDSEPRTTQEEEFEEEGPRNPFDNPYFLPAVLFGFALWFGWDGWFNPAMAEHLLFNRVGFGVLLVLAAVSFLRARKEVRATRTPGADQSPPTI